MIRVRHIRALCPGLVVPVTVALSFGVVLAPQIARDERAQARAAQQPTPPPAMVPYWSWPSWRQRQALTACGDDPRLPLETVAFLRALIERRDDLVARNLAANALVRQDRPVAGLVERFAAIALDPTETPGWRDFATQQLADAIAAAPTIDDAAVAPLLRLARCRGPIAGTALLQLQRLIDERGAPVSDGFIRARLDAALADATGEPALAVTALGLAARRGDRPLLPRVRACSSSSSPAIRRTAIASLGMLGDPEDRDLVDAATRDPDPTVARAAAAALARIDARPQ